jgi:hypothetical protein
LNFRSVKISARVKQPPNDDIIISVTVAMVPAAAVDVPYGAMTGCET